MLLMKVWLYGGLISMMVTLGLYFFTPMRGLIDYHIASNIRRISEKESLPEGKEPPTGAVLAVMFTLTFIAWPVYWAIAINTARHRRK